MSANIRRQIAGHVARFFPPGHSSAVKSIGQFSIPIRTFRSSACWTRGRQTSRNRGQLASTESAGSRPTNELTTADAELGRGVDQAVQVLDRQLRLGPVGGERVRIIAQARDLDPMKLDQVANVANRPRGQVGNIEVRHPGIPPLRAAGRPAHHFDARVPRLGGEVQDLLQRVLRQDRRDEPEFHRARAPL